VSEGVKSVLRQREAKFGFIRGLVADVLRVDVEHAATIEAALDGRDQLLVAESLEAVVGAREAFEELEGRVNVICGTGGSPVVLFGDETFAEANPTGDHGRAAHATIEEHGQDARDTNPYDWNRHPYRVRLAIDLVRFEASDSGIARHLLGRTVIVDDLGAAASLHREGPAGYRYVTGAGEVIEADGTFRAGPFTASMGLLSRRSELEAIGFQILKSIRALRNFRRS